MNSSRVFILLCLVVAAAACGGSPQAPQATSVPAATVAPTSGVQPGAAAPTNAPQPTTAAVQPTVVLTPTEVLSPTVPVSPTIAGVRVITGTGATAAELTPTVDAYRRELGGPNNGGVAGTQPGGHREINWDGVPDELAAPNLYPADFFNAPTDPRARGAILSTPGTGLMVSAGAANPAGVLPRFGNLNPQYATIFKPFSEERIFSPLESNIVNLEFFVPGTNTPAVVRGYGAVYLDVDQPHTAFEYFDIEGNSLGRYDVPIANQALSFLGVVFPEPIVHRVRIEYGTQALGPDDSADVDVAVMDDFIYGEPQAAESASVQPPAPPTTTVSAGEFTQIGDSLNRDKNEPGADQALTIGSVFAGAEWVPWAAWAEKSGTTQQIFVARQNGNTFENVGGSLNIHQNVIAERPSIDFAGQDRAVPWAAWDEPSPTFGNKKQIFASRYNNATGIWTPAGADRGGNEPSLNIHTDKDAANPILIGASTDPTNPPAPWVCWQEDSAQNNTIAIFVARGVAESSALGGFRWEPVGLNRGGTAQDPEPNLNVNVGHGDGEDCWITFAGENNTVPWVVWQERTGAEPGRILVSRAVADNTPGAGGFRWESVPNCPGETDTSGCALNVNPTRNATDPFMTAGTTVAGQAAAPWITWTEVGPTGKNQVFVDRLDPGTRDRFLNVGGSLNVNQNAEAEGPSITFLGNVPYVAWSETVGNVSRVFVRHLASDPQTGTWVLDTPQDGLAVNKGAGAFYPIIRAAPGGKVVLVWREGDPANEPSQIVVCESSKLTALLERVAGAAFPLLQGKACQ